MKNKENLSTFFEKVIIWFTNHWLLILFLLLSITMPFLWLHSDFLYTPEENLFANYQIISDKYFFSWSDKLNYGTPASPEFQSLMIPNAIFFKSFSALGFNNNVIQIIYLQCFLFASFLAISYFLKIFTTNKKLILLGSATYIFNFYFYQAISYSAKMSQIILVPLLFALTYNYLLTKKRSYIFLNFVFFFLLQGIFCNLPQLVATLTVYLIAILFFLFRKKYSLRIFFSLYAKKLFVFFAILLPIFLYQGLIFYFSMFQNFDTIKKYSSFSAITSSLGSIFQFRGVWWEYGAPNNIPYNHWLWFYDSKIIILTTFFIIVLTLLLLFLNKKNKQIKKAYLVWIFVFLIYIFLSSGSSFYPKLFLLLYDHFPFFYIFREPWAKFMIFIIFAFSALIVLAIKKNANKKLYYFLLILVCVRALPFFSPNFFDHSNADWKKLLIKTPAYWNEYFNWSKNNQDKYILSFPFSRIKSTGIDLEYHWYPQDLGNSNISIPYVFDETNAVREKLSYSRISKFNQIAEIFDDSNSSDFLKLGTVNYLLEQKDCVSLNAFSSEEETVIRQRFESIPQYSFGNNINLYKIKDDFYLPHLNIPTKVIISKRGLEEFPRIISQNDWQTRSAVFFEEQNIGKDETLKKMNSQTPSQSPPSKGGEDSGLPILEFKKINPTKYRVRVHGAKKEFPLIFSESFHDGWRAYISNSPTPPQSSPQAGEEASLDDYKILDGNEDDQANKEELEEYIQKGWVTDLGDGEEKEIKHQKWNEEKQKEELDYVEEYNIDFVSKNFQDTIQNDNLPSVHFWETWLANKEATRLPRYARNDKVFELPEENHLMVNGYANSWVIDPENICVSSTPSQSPPSKGGEDMLCIKNPDGSYDFELVVEFWPQRLFYVGLSISGLTLLGCLTYLGYDWKKRRKIASLTKVEN